MTEKAQVSEEVTPATFKAQASRHLSNTGGIELMLNYTNDMVYFRNVYGQDLNTAPVYEADIYYEANTDEEDEEDHDSSTGYFYDEHGNKEYLSNYLVIR